MSTLSVAIEVDPRVAEAPLPGSVRDFLRGPRPWLWHGVQMLLRQNSVAAREVHRSRPQATAWPRQALPTQTRGHVAAPAPTIARPTRPAPLAPPSNLVVSAAVGGPDFSTRSRASASQCWVRSAVRVSTTAASTKGTGSFAARPSFRACSVKNPFSKVDIARVWSPSFCTGDLPQSLVPLNQLASRLLIGPFQSLRSTSNTRSSSTMIRSISRSPLPGSARSKLVNATQLSGSPRNFSSPSTSRWWTPRPQFTIFIAPAPMHIIRYLFSHLS